jgi:hypothetical protein
MQVPIENIKYKSALPDCVMQTGTPMNLLWAIFKGAFATNENFLPEQQKLNNSTT